MTTPVAEIDDRRAQACRVQADLATAAAPLMIVACPGAGKTRLIVDRHLASPAETRQGRAVVSFTRVAARQVTERCVVNGRSDLLAHPHFVGTLDTFLWLHLVRPFLATDRPWQRLESWDDAPYSRRSFVHQQQRYRLAEVQFSYNPVRRSWSARPRRPRGTVGRPWAWQANRAREDLVDLGYLTGDELRAFATDNLRLYGPKLGRLLTAKYTEVVVDEAQDCSALDVHILDQLHNHGVPLVIVADPEQAIYGFRGAATADLTQLGKRLETKVITGNWRSSQNICTLAATLRTDPTRQTPDTALADHHNDDTPTLVLSSRDPAAATSIFLREAAQLEIRASECMVLSHRNSSLPKPFAGPGTAPTANAPALMWAVGILNEFHAAPQQKRKQAKDTLARAVLRWWYTDADSSTAEATLNSNDVATEAFERLMRRILDAMSCLDMPAKEWVTQAKKVLTDNPPTASATRTSTRLTLGASESRNARAVAGLGTATTSGEWPHLSTVHRAKGDEAPAVLLLLPNNDQSDNLIEAWTSGRTPQGETAEAMRVAYVGATRAKRLLAVAVAEKHMDNVAVAMTKAGVGVRTIGVDNPTPTQDRRAQKSRPII